MNSDPLTDLRLSHNHHLAHAQENAVQLFQTAFLRSPPTPDFASQSPRLLPLVDFPHKTSPTPHTAYSSRDDESWEVLAFAVEDTSCDDGLQWPPPSCSCSFCRRECGTAQALGGHTNIHRRQRALLRLANAGEQSPFPLDGSVCQASSNLGSTVCPPAHSRNTLTIPHQQSVSQNLLHLPESSLPRANPTFIPFLMPVDQDTVATSLTLAPYNPSTNRLSGIPSLQQLQMEKARKNVENQGLRSVKVVDFGENKSEVINTRKAEEHSLSRLRMCKQRVDLELRLGP